VETQLRATQLVIGRCSLSLVVAVVFDFPLYALFLTMPAGFEVELALETGKACSVNLVLDRAFSRPRSFPNSCVSCWARCTSLHWPSAKAASMSNSPSNSGFASGSTVSLVEFGRNFRLASNIRLIYRDLEIRMRSAHGMIETRKDPEGLTNKGLLSIAWPLVQK
jgi:hypothetical protein